MRREAIAWYEYLLTIDNTLGIDPWARVQQAAWAQRAAVEQE